MKYTINKGIGRSVEFKGLKAQYLFLFAGGLLAVFVLLVIFYTAGAISGRASASARGPPRRWCSTPSV